MEQHSDTCAREQTIEHPAGTGEKANAGGATVIMLMDRRARVLVAGRDLRKAA